MCRQIRSMLLSSNGFLPHPAKKEPSIDRFTPKDDQVNISHEACKIFMYFFLPNCFAVVAAAIEGNVDCED